MNKNLQIENLQVKKINNGQKKCIIMLHGYGANADDLAPIENVVNFSKEYDWYFVNAPICLGANLGVKSLAWFEISEDLFLRNQSNYFDLFATSTPTQFENTLFTLKTTYQQIAKDYQSIVLAGFSQGAMMALHLLNDLNVKEQSRVKDLILFSSVLCAKEKLKNLSQNISIFQSHGNIDQVLPYNEGKKLEEFLGHFTQVSFFEFTGGHQIPIDALKAWENFMLK